MNPTITTSSSYISSIIYHHTLAARSYSISNINQAQNPCLTMYK